MSAFKTNMLLIAFLIVSGCVSKHPETVQVENLQNKKGSSNYANDGRSTFKSAINAHPFKEWNKVQD